MQKDITAVDFQTKGPLSHYISASCDHNGGVIISKYGDLRLTVPKGAIECGDCVTFLIASYFYGPFVLPSKCHTDVVSPYYWIEVQGSYRFHKPVQVEFEHFAAVTACDPSHYQLLTCEDTDKSYTMQPVNYHFSFKEQDGISWCTFQTYHFCSYCLYHGCKDPIINKIAALYLKTQDFQGFDDFTAEIWFSFAISHCLKRNEELYTSEGLILDKQCSYNFEASCDKNSTSFFTLNYHNNNDGWCMQHLRSTEIKTKEINFYNYYTDMEELKANENKALFPQRFIVKVIKELECKNDLNTNIMVTLHKKKRRKLESIPFKLFVSLSTLTSKEKTTSLTGS